VGDLSSGWPALISVLLVGFGITNISLGIIAEYLWRTLDETRRRPNYIVEHELNFQKEK
jgi:dolichol-phosphate mannosyltransferase